MEKLIRQLGNRSLKGLATATCFFASLLSLSTPSLAEGTKELAPTAADFNRADMHIFDVSGGITRDFMTYIADDQSRLNIEICNPGEMTYFGFNYNTADISGCSKLYYRIKSPSGFVLYYGEVTNTGPGSIGSYAQAVIGPNNLVGGAGGYNAIGLDLFQLMIDSSLTNPSLTPELGPYSIEFNPNNQTTFVNSTNACTGSIRAVRLPLFDITVADGVNGNPIKGRLWSKAWDLITNSFTNPFNATMYVYADDGIVTNINFNAIQPNGFIVSCNRTGVTDSGNAFNDRKSIPNANSTYGQYRIFLNNPDENCFPTGIFGALTGPINVSGCDQNNRCINIPVDKQGDAQLILNLNGVPGYQPGTRDRLISTVLGVGNNCILWDSRDGLGNIVTPGTNIDIQLDYFNGLTNLPMYDVENHRNGFIVNLIRPAGPQPRLFFDDTNVPGGVSDLTGCVSGVPPNGCHRWNGTTTGPNGVTPVPSAYGWGDLHTINTWWYANIITATASYNVATIVVDADASNAVGVPNTRTVCTTTPTLSLNGSVTGSSTTGIWSRVGGGGNFLSDISLNTTYTFSAADYAAGTVKLILTSSNNGACPPAIDTLTISVIAGPTVNAGGPVTVCANNAVIANLGGSFGGAATGATWTGGTTARFAPNRNTPTAQYTPTAAEIAGTTLVLTITSTGSGICPEVSATKTITFSTPPTVTMGPNVTVCRNNAAATVTATPANHTSVLWTGGAAGSSFANATSNTATYTPAPSELAAAPTSVTLTFTASKTGCTPVSGTLNVSITPTPTVNAGPNRTICSNDSINLVGTRTNAPSSVWSSPTAVATSFKPNATNLSTNYKPTAADIANGSVVISLTSSGNNCTPVVSTMTLTITPAPTINAGLDKVVCANNPTTTITATTSAAGVQWSVGGGTYSASNTSNPLTYTLSAGEVAASSAGLIVRTTGGTCPPVVDTVFIFVTPAPTVSAGPDLPSCQNNATVQVTGATTSASDITWSTLNGGAFSNTGLINPFFTPSATDIAAGTATIIITANDPGCLPVRDTALVIIAPTPIVSAGPNRSVCSNNATVSFSGTVTNATGLIWSSAGDGRFSPGATLTATGLTPTYVPGANDISSGGPIIITARSTGHGAQCTQVSSTTQLTIYAAPTVVGSASSVCANNAASIALTATSGNGAVTTTWSGGAGGTFGAANSLNTTYTTLPAERVAGNTIIFTITATKPGCTNVSDTARAVITAPATITPGTGPTVCATTPLANLSATVTLPATGVTWTGAGAFSASNSLTTTYTPTATEIANGTASVTLTSTGNGNCSPVNASMTITITPPPTVNAGNNQTVCGSNPTVSLAATATSAGTPTWTIITGTGSFTNSASLTSNYNVTPADLTRGFVDLRITVQGLNGCAPAFDDIHISFTPVPSANAGPNQTVCTTDFPVQLSGSGSVGTWTSASGNAAGFSNASALNSTYTPSASEIAAHTATVRYTTNASAFCPSVFSEMIITIVDGPAVSAGTPATICGNGTINLTGTVTGPSTTGGFWSTADGTGTINNPNALSTTYTISAADITRGTVTFDLASVGNAQCNVVHSTVTYTILAPITVSAGPNQNACGLGGISLNGTSSTGTATWSILAGTGSFDNANALNAVFTPTVALPGVVTLRLTTTGNGSCPAQQADVTYNISPAPTLSAGPNQTICADSAYVQLAGNFTIASGIRWSKIVGTGTFAPDSVSINSRYTPSAADRTAGTVTLRATTTGNGICAAVTADMTITITPRVTITAGDDQTLCANNAVATIGGTVSGGSTTGAWTSSSGHAAGFANAAALSTTYTPSATDIANALVTLTFTSTANGNCKPTADQLIIHYTPAPVVNAGLPLTVCASSITTGGVALNGTITGGSSTGIWSSPTPGSSFTPNNTTLNAHYIPTAADTIAKTVTLTLTSTGNGNCNAVSQNVVVTFAPLPVVNAGNDVTICADSFFVALDGIVANAGGGIWSTTAGAGNFLPSTVTLNANFTPSAAARTAGVAVLTLTSTSNGPCPAVADNKIITITPAPTVSAGPDITVCANDSLANLTGAFTIASGVQWSSNGSQSFSSATSTTTTYAPNALDISSSPLTLTIRTTGNGMCKPATDQMTLTITPAPIVNAGPNQTVCADIAGVQLNGAVTAGSTTGSWSTPTTGGTFSPNAATLNAVYNLAPADITSGSVVLTLTSTNNGLCQAVSQSMTILVTPAPTVNAGTDQTICADGTANLNGSFTVASGIQWSSAGGGTFSPSAFVTNPVYTPSAADTTAHSAVITLTTTGNGTCLPASQSINLTINPIPIVEAGLNRVVCADVDQVNLSAYVLHATGGTWVTNGTGTFSPNANTVNTTYVPSADDISSGIITLSLSATGAGTCGPVSDNMTITFTPVASVSAGPDINVCTGTASINVNGSVTNTSNFEWSIISGTTGGSITAASINTLIAQYQAVPSDAVVTLRLTAMPGGGCSNVDDDMQITFSSAPPIDAGPNQIVCTSELPIKLAATGTTAQWAPSGGTFLPNDQTLNATYMPSAGEIAMGSVTLTLNTTNNGVCPTGSDFVTITIRQGPVVSAGPDITICRNVPAVNVVGTANAISTTVQWTRISSSGSFDNNASLSTNYTPSASDYSAGLATLVLTSTANVNGCLPVSDTMQIFVTPEPTLNLGPNITVCGDAVSVPLNATTTNSSAVNWSGGAGSFAPPAGNNTIYTFNPGDPMPGTLVLQAEAIPLVSGATCNNVIKTISINRTPIPTVNAGSGPITRCTSNPNVTLSGTITVASGGSWTTNGTGAFSPNNTIVAPGTLQYIPSPADLLLPSVVLTLTTTGNGQCQAYSSPITVNFDTQPVIDNAASSQPVYCAGNVISLSATTVPNALGVLWTKNGADGTFDDNTSKTPEFTPGPNDIANGGMILTVTTTTTGTTTCAQAARNIAIGIVPSPVASINAGFDQILCADVDTVQLNGFIAVAMGGKWTSSGTGIFLPNDEDLSAEYIPSATEKDPSTPIVITLESTGNGLCTAVTDEMNITFTPIPDINAGADMIVCADTAYIQLNPTFNNALGSSWTTNGTGTFAPNGTTDPTTYVLSDNDRTLGSIGFTVSTTGNGTCKTYESSLALTITPKPTLDLGPDRIVCAAATTVNFNASTTVASATLWSSSGAGSFSPNPNLATAYTVMPADTATKTINIFAESANQGNCKAVYDTLQLTFQPVPLVVAGPPISSCANVPTVNLISGAVYNATGGRWTSSGNGNFTNPNNQLANVYTPSPTDRANGTVTLTLTSTGNGQCGASFGQLTITIAPSPIVTANPAILCEPTLGAALSGTVSAPFNGAWSSSLPGGSFAPSPTLISTYFPSAAETAAGKAVLTLTSTDNGTCNPETATIDIVIEPLPIADAGPDQFTCNNGEITLIANPMETGITYTWHESGNPGSPNPNPYQPSVTTNTIFVLTASDAKGCQVRDTMTANVFTIPANFNILPNPACFEENMLIESNPDVLPAQGGIFQWFRDNSLLAGQNKTFINPDVAGVYKITYFFSKTCTASASTTVNAPPQITTEDVIDCNPTTILEATLIGSNNVTYNWSPETSTISTVTVPVIAGDTTVHYVNVTDVATTCVARDSVYVIGLPVPLLIPIDSIACANSTVKVSARPTNIPDLDQFFNNLSFSWTKNGNADPNTDSLYFVTQDSLYVGTVNIGRCSASVNHKVVFKPYPTSILPENTKFCDEKSVTLELIAGPNSPSITYVWKDDLASSTVLSNVYNLFVTPTQTSKYYVNMTNQYGCGITDSILVRDICEPRLFNPNAFTPGCTNCANNNVFQVYGAHIGRYKITIFNRWGEVIFNTEDLNHSWDGMYLNEMMPVGVYPFIIYYEGKEEYSHINNTIKGKVTLIR
jgi:gliding motility-associated-like protein